MMEDYQGGLISEIIRKHRKKRKVSSSTEERQKLAKLFSPKEVKNLKNKVSEGESAGKTKLLKQNINTDKCVVDKSLTENPKKLSQKKNICRNYHKLRGQMQTEQNKKKKITKEQVPPRGNQASKSNESCGTRQIIPDENNVSNKQKHLNSDTEQISKKKIWKNSQTGQDVDNEKSTETSQGAGGFCPPPGIVHESLLKNKKQKKKKTKDEEDTEDRKMRSVKSRDTSTDFRTVFVGNLPVMTNKKDLMKLFRKFGDIETVRLRCAPRANAKLPKRAAVILKEFHPERNNICAYICFKEEEQAKKALKLNGKKVDKLHIRVDIASHDSKFNHKYSVFIGNLPLDVAEEDIREHFNPCGKIDNIRVVRDRQTGVGKGISFVTFKSSDSVSLALKLNNTELSRRTIRVEYCQESSKKDRSLNKIKIPAVSRKEKETKKIRTKKFHMKPSNMKTGAVFRIKNKHKNKKKQKHTGK